MQELFLVPDITLNKGRLRISKLIILWIPERTEKSKYLTPEGIISCNFIYYMVCKI